MEQIFQEAAQGDSAAEAIEGEVVMQAASQGDVAQAESPPPSQGMVTIQTTPAPAAAVPCSSFSSNVLSFALPPRSSRAARLYARAATDSTAK